MLPADTDVTYLGTSLSIIAGDDDTDWHTELRTAIAAEQGTDTVQHGSMGMTGFMPSANPAWRDADFQTQQQRNSHGCANQQPDINEQGWLPR